MAFFGRLWAIQTLMERFEDFIGINIYRVSCSLK